MKGYDSKGTVLFSVESIQNIADELCIFDIWLIQAVSFV